MEVQKGRNFSKEFREDLLNMLKTEETNVPTFSKEIGIAETEKISDKEKEIVELRAMLADVTEGESF